MEITNVKVRVIDNASNPKMKAFATITFDDELAVNDIRILKGKDDVLFLQFPNKPMAPGEFKDVAHPVNQEARDKFTKVVIDEYYKELEKNKED